MNLRCAFLPVWLCVSGIAQASSVGESFGEYLRVLNSARQTGTGGVAIEDPWRADASVDTTTIRTSSGLRWYAIGAQGAGGGGSRLAAEGYSYSSGPVTKTVENSDGSFGGERGSFDVTEWGARLEARRRIFNTGEWEGTIIARAMGSTQRLTERTNVGVAAEGGLQLDKTLEGGSGLAGWATVGPLGRGADRWFAGQLRIGGALRGRTRNLLWSEGGYATGCEGEILGEGLVRAGLGAVLWIGKPGEQGTTLFLRGGVRGASGSIQSLQPRAGLGGLWRLRSGFGVAFDYGWVPAGSLGAYHFGSVGIRFPTQEIE